MIESQKKIEGVATSKMPTGGELEHNEDLGPVQVSTPHTEVEVACGVTLNLGNYQSARLDVRVRVPCDSNVEAMNTAFQFAKEWTDAKLNGMVKEAKESLG